MIFYERIFVKIVGIKFHEMYISFASRLIDNYYESDSISRFFQEVSCRDKKYFFRKKIAFLTKMQTLFFFIGILGRYKIFHHTLFLLSEIQK